MPNIPPMGTDMHAFYETQPADKDWLDEELIPFLDVAYGPHPPGFWAREVLNTTLQLAEHEVHEDFPSTIERFRMLLVNPDVLTRAEIKDFSQILNFRDNYRICIGVFVRHNIHHGWYKLHSLGKEPDPDHPRLKDTTNVQDTYIFGGKLQVGHIDSTKRSRSSTGYGDTSEPDPEVQSAVDQSYEGQYTRSSSSEEETPPVEPTSGSHHPSNLLNEPVDPKDSGETAVRVEQWLDVLPRRPGHPPSEEVARETLRATPFHAKKTPRSYPGNILRRPPGQNNGPHPSHASRPRRGNHQGNAPRRPRGNAPHHPQENAVCQPQGKAGRNDQGSAPRNDQGDAPQNAHENAPRNDHGALRIHQPQNTFHNAMYPPPPPAIQSPRPPVGLNDPYLYQGLALPGGGYPVPHTPYPTFVQSPRVDGHYYGYPVQYPPPGYHGSSPQLHGDYQVAYAPLGNVAPLSQGHGSFFPAQAHPHPDENSDVHPQAASPVYEPGARDGRLRMDANDFVQGASGHGV